MATYEIIIDRESCDGDKLCCEYAPETFEIDDDGKARVINPQGDPSEDILEAARKCPLQGIRLIDHETGATVWPHD